MAAEKVKEALQAVHEAELSKISRVADRLFTGRPVFAEGSQRRRLKAGRGMEFLDYRDYAPGDDARSVDWRASARHPNLLVRRHHDQSASQWYVCLDRSASMRIPGEDKWLLAVKLAAAFLYLLLHRVNRVGLLTFSDQVDRQCPAGSGRKQYKRVMSVLSTTSARQIGGGSNLETCSSRLGWRSSAIVISDFLIADGMKSGLDSIVRLGGRVHALQVLSDRECQVDSAGPAVLQDVESGERIVAHFGQSSPQHAARERLAQLQVDLAGHCRRRDIAFTPCDADQNWMSVVITHLISASRNHA